MRRIRRGKEAPALEDNTINLTPLIDVVFVVLIMFILVAPMMELDRIQLASAPPHTTKEMVAVQEQSSVTIRVNADNSIDVNGKRVMHEQLLSLLKKAKEKHLKSIPQLFHDKKASFGTYQFVKNTVESSGFEQLDIILQPGE